MSKISLIIQREYISRVKKKSFIIMTILGPLLIAAIGVVPAFLATYKNETTLIKVIDETSLFTNSFKENEKLKFDYSLEELSKAKKDLYKSPYTALLYIPRTIVQTPNGVMLYYKKEPGFITQRYLEKEVSKQLQKQLLQANKVEQTVIDKLEDRVSINLIDLDEEGKEKKGNTNFKTIIGYIAGFLIYMFVFLYGVQVMRGVIEEKTNRIVEVIISSVKPFQLMLGKIIGVALVGLTQFLLWVVLSLAITSIVTAVIGQKYSSANIAQSLQKSGGDLDAKERQTMETFASITENIESMNFPVIIFCFIIFFLGGYLIYSALFAAVGAAVDSETDTQQFMLPVSVPLILSIIFLQYVLNDPDSTLSLALSLFPLTSPIIMMARVPFGIPYWQIALSIVLLILGFLAIVWVAGRIYRTGIMMYGKKVTFKEIGKWLTYKS